MALISIISTYFGWKSMELEEFNKKQEIAFQTRFEHEQLEILEMEDTAFFDENPASTCKSHRRKIIQ